MSKLEKLCNAYEKFGQAIATIPDDMAKKLTSMSEGVRGFILEARKHTPRPTPSQLAAGLEQGWRETPMLIQCVAAEWRGLVSKAWHEATLLAYPEFLVMESQRLQKILDRRKIRTEAEFYRVRHEIDVLEGQAQSQAQLQDLYSLVEVYEKR